MSLSKWLPCDFEQCHALLWSGGILVDHWSTISSCSWHCVIINMLFHTLWWRHNGRDGVSNHQPHDCLLTSLFRRRSKKTSKLRVTGLCGGISPGTGEFPAQMASYAENVSIWWCHHGISSVSLIYGMVCWGLRIHDMILSNLLITLMNPSMAFIGRGFSYPCKKFHELIENVDIFLCFFKRIWHEKGYQISNNNILKCYTPIITGSRIFIHPLNWHKEHCIVITT